jgi:hypothetical protein
VEHEWICEGSELGEYVFSPGFSRHVAKHGCDVSAVCRRSRGSSRASLCSKVCLAPEDWPLRSLARSKQHVLFADVMPEHNTTVSKSSATGFRRQRLRLVHPDQPPNTQELQKLATRPAAHGPVSLLQAPNTKFVNTDVASSWTPRPEVIS